MIIYIYVYKEREERERSLRYIVIADLSGLEASSHDIPAGHCYVPLRKACAVFFWMREVGGKNLCFHAEGSNSFSARIMNGR